MQAFLIRFHYFLWTGRRNQWTATKQCEEAMNQQKECAVVSTLASNELFSTALSSSLYDSCKSDIAEVLVHTRSMSDKNTIDINSMTLHLLVALGITNQECRFTWWPQPKAISFGLVRQMGQICKTSLEFNSHQTRYVKALEERKIHVDSRMYLVFISRGWSRRGGCSGRRSVLVIWTRAVLKSIHGRGFWTATKCCRTIDRGRKSDSFWNVSFPSTESTKTWNKVS